MPNACDAAGSRHDEAASVLLDLTGLKCPLPALRTRKALRSLEPGTRLVVTATDPLAGLDIPNVVREEGGRIETQVRVPVREDTPDVEAWRFTIRGAG